jgi:hypothetical protein
LLICFFLPRKLCTCTASTSSSNLQRARNTGVLSAPKSILTVLRVFLDWFCFSCNVYLYIIWVALRPDAGFSVRYFIISSIESSGFRKFTFLTILILRPLGTDEKRTLAGCILILEKLESETRHRGEFSVVAILRFC